MIFSFKDLVFDTNTMPYVIRDGEVVRDNEVIHATNWKRMLQVIGLVYNDTQPLTLNEMIVLIVDNIRRLSLQIALCNKNRGSH